MSAPQPCPHLPPAGVAMSYRNLREHKQGDPAAYYLAALQYGHCLWLQGHAGRAILALTRALYTARDGHAIYSECHCLRRNPLDRSLSACSRKIRASVFSIRQAACKLCTAP